MFLFISFLIRFVLFIKTSIYLFFSSLRVKVSIIVFKLFIVNLFIMKVTQINSKFDIGFLRYPKHNFIIRVC